ncbi:MAG: dephospho-CoA kinase [Tannerellaceae bacterium]|jgi:dephospho-CoA kinase|nr:dephospho-CoA kinase [Tannerellaceae bacterium]
MIKLGLTGGIGSGKSTVASLFDMAGVPVYIADTESKRLTNTSPVIRKGLIDLFGKDLYIDGALDKKRLASLIFNDKDNLNRVNAIIHPEVNRDFLQWVSGQQTSVCAIETAILFESGFDKSVDMSVMVYAPFELRIERAVTRDKAPYEEIIRRVHNQLPDEIKKERADFIIYNDDKQALIPQVEKLMSVIQVSVHRFFNRTM